MMKTQHVFQRKNLHVKSISLLCILFAVVLFSGCASSKKSASGRASVRVARVTDNQFRAYLLAQNYVTPYQGPMRKLAPLTPRSEAVEVTPLGEEARALNCHRMNIRSIDGLELFPRLETLVCSENPIRKLDLQQAPELKELVAAEVPLRKLDVSRNAKLRMLNVSYTDLKFLDVSQNAMLEELLCIYSPDIKSIDVSHNPHLQKPYTRNTNIPLIDLRSNLEIKSIFANDCPLQYIVVSPQHDLDNIKASVDSLVRLVVLDKSDPLPEVDTTAIPVIQRIANPTFKQGKPLVVLSGQAAVDADREELRRQYPPAFTYDSITKQYSRNGVVNSDEQFSQFILTYQLFLSGLSDELKRQGFSFDKEYRTFCLGFYSEEGYAEYFIYKFLGDEPSPAAQREFERILTEYLSETPVGFVGWRPFSQCGPVVFKQADSSEEDSTEP